MTLQPNSPESNFLKRIARRYKLNFTIYTDAGLVQEFGEYGLETSREATDPELTMWNIIIPKDLQEKVNKAYLGGDLALDATVEELEEALLGKSIVYLSAQDFQVLITERPKGAFDFIMDRNVLLSGHVANYGKTKVFVSRDIPKGYYHCREVPDPMLNWQPPPGERQIKPEINSLDYYLEPLLAPH